MSRFRVSLVIRVLVVLGLNALTCLAGEIKLINPAENKNTAILTLINEDNEGYEIRAKPGATIVKQLQNGTYRWLLECPKRHIVGGEGGFIKGKGWVITSKVVVTDKHGTKWEVPKGH